MIHFSMGSERKYVANGALRESGIFQLNSMCHKGVLKVYVALI